MSNPTGSLALSPGYIAGTQVPLVMSGVQPAVSRPWDMGVLTASAFSIAAPLTPVSLSVSGAGAWADRTGAQIAGSALNPIRQPAAILSIYANGSNAVPSGAPLVTTGLFSLTQLSVPLTGQSQLPAGLYWSVVEFFTDGFPFNLPLQGTSPAIALNLATAKLANPGGTAITLAGTEAWGSASASPLVLMGI